MNKILEYLEQLGEIIKPFEVLDTLIPWLILLFGFIIVCIKVFKQYFMKNRFTKKLSDDVKFKLNKYSEKSAKKLSRAQPDNPWIKNDYAEIIGFRNDFPRIKVVGEYSLESQGTLISDEVVRNIEEVANNKRQTLKNNETFGILKSDILDASLEEITVQVADYAYISTIRDYIKENKLDVSFAPQSLTAGSLIICPKAKVIVVQLRDENCNTHGGMYHTLGGSYQAPQKLSKDEYDISRDRNNLRYTMIREVFEESKIILDNCKVSKIHFMIKQIGDGYIQYYPLNSVISEDELSVIEGVEEGDTVKIKFDDLELSLTNDNWVPSGKLHVLMWLAFGAPDTNPLTKFNGLTPEQLFNKIIDSAESD